MNIRKSQHALIPPEEVAKEAAKGLDLRKKYKVKGGTSVGIARARDLKNRKHISDSIVQRMVSYFARHEID